MSTHVNQQQQQQDEPVFMSAYDLPAKGATPTAKGATPTTKGSLKERPAKVLMPMRNQVAKANKQLFEPLTPTDFKPTPEWVCDWII